MEEEVVAKKHTASLSNAKQKCSHECTKWLSRAIIANVWDRMLSLSQVLLLPILISWAFILYAGVEIWRGLWMLKNYDEISAYKQDEIITKRLKNVRKGEKKVVFFIFWSFQAIVHVCSWSYEWNVYVIIMNDIILQNVRSNKMSKDESWTSFTLVIGKFIRFVLTFSNIFSVLMNSRCSWQSMKINTKYNLGQSDKFPVKIG